MTVDREDALRKAEKLVRQGRLDAAIEAYLQIVDDHPGDWGTANALGDLYVRTGDLDKAASQFTRIADHFRRDSVLPKAVAVYKKVLRIRPQDETARLRLGEIVAEQGLLVDARSYLTAVHDLRVKRGDDRGAKEIVAQLGLLDAGDMDARLSGARAIVELGEREAAVDRFNELAAELTEAGRHDEALAALREVARLDPDNKVAKGRLARACVEHGDLDDARQYLTREVAGNDPELLLTFAELELRAARLESARPVLGQLVTVDRAQRDRVEVLGGALCDTDPAAAFLCLDAVVDAAMSQQEWETAAGVLHGFTTRVPNQIEALIKLVEVCIDGGLESMMFQAQAKLADAYLAHGRPTEAQMISEDLAVCEPGDPAHIERLHRTLVMAGEPAPSKVIAERLSEAMSFAATDQPSQAGIAVEHRTSPVSPRAAPDDHPSGPPSPMPDSQAGDEFAEFREKVSQQASVDAAGEQYKLALSYREAGMIDEAITVLEDAVRLLEHRFDAAFLLGRLCREQGATSKAIEWFERAAEAPASSPPEGRALLYELGEALEAQGEAARSLAVLLELKADASDYRDVHARIERLSRVVTGG